MELYCATWGLVGNGNTLVQQRDMQRYSDHQAKQQRCLQSIPDSFDGGLEPGIKLIDLAVVWEQPQSCFTVQLCKAVSLYSCVTVQLCHCTAVSLYSCVQLCHCTAVSLYSCVQLCHCITVQLCAAVSLYSCVTVQLCAAVSLYSCVTVLVSDMHRFGQNHTLQVYTVYIRYF